MTFKWRTPSGTPNYARQVSEYVSMLYPLIVDEVDIGTTTADISAHKDRFYARFIRLRFASYIGSSNSTVVVKAPNSSGEEIWQSEGLPFDRDFLKEEWAQA